jgi:hypothetical protein
VRTLPRDALAQAQAQPCATRRKRACAWPAVHAPPRRGAPGDARAFDSTPSSAALAQQRCCAGRGAARPAGLSSRHASRAAHA